MGFKTLRRTRLSGNTVTNGVDCLILDTLGELSTLYPAADLVFVGGTLVPVGGHNLLEPAFYGKAVVTGPHLENVKEIAQVLKGKGALFVVRDPEELKVVVSRLLDDPVGLERAGERGRLVVEENRGVCDRVVERIFADGRG
ncbi:MAG: hypothetical protein D6713_09860 [Deltaproteobacteria bacterium]|nr:MAG: hypothetical protein D6713_09860 [Deltaproteobacteria bacterium]